MPIDSNRNGRRQANRQGAVSPANGLATVLLVCALVSGHGCCVVRQVKAYAGLTADTAAATVDTGTVIALTCVEFHDRKGRWPASLPELTAFVEDLDARIPQWWNLTLPLAPHRVLARIDTFTVKAVSETAMTVWFSCEDLSPWWRASGGEEVMTSGSGTVTVELPGGGQAPDPVPRPSR